MGSSYGCRHHIHQGESKTMCCGMGHLDALITSAYDPAFLQKTGSQGAYAKGAYGKAYAAPSYASSEGGLETAMGREVVEYSIRVGSQGQVEGYIIAISRPGYRVGQEQARIPPRRTSQTAPQHQGLVLYDPLLHEAVDVPQVYDGAVKALRNSRAEHWVVPVHALKQDAARSLFARPPKEKIACYDVPNADYSRASHLRNRIAQRKSELGVDIRKIEQIKQAITIDDEQQREEVKQHVQWN